MIDISRDINSLSNFKRDTAAFIRQLKETGEPVILTVNGKPEIVVQDARSYQELRELIERLMRQAGLPPRDVPSGGR
jgi:prevent-host-death family protein